MGDPKKPRAKYVTPRHPWRREDLLRELELIGTYGLRNKRELWRAETELSRIRRQARLLLAAPPSYRAKMESVLLNKLARLGLLGERATLDDILSLKVEDLLERRLQTIVWRKGLAKTPYHARQLITHRHVTIGGVVVTKPSYIVPRNEEDKIALRSTLKGGGK
jgi:small subunit ribosomal protein S4